MVPLPGYYIRPATVEYRVQVTTRHDRGKWSAPSDVPFTGRGLAIAWADQGTALLGIDSSWQIVVQPISGGAPRPVRTAVRVDSMTGPTGTGVRSSDGRFWYFVRRQYSTIGWRPNSVIQHRIADGALREVLRFDEPARPQSNASNGIAEFNGSLYFTLSDGQSDIWIATVSGLSP